MQYIFIGKSFTGLISFILCHSAAWWTCFFSHNNFFSQWIAKLVHRFHGQSNYSSLPLRCLTTSSCFIKISWPPLDPTDLFLPQTWHAIRIIAKFFKRRNFKFKLSHTVRRRYQININHSNLHGPWQNLSKTRFHVSYLDSEFGIKQNNHYKKQTQ